MKSTVLKALALSGILAVSSNGFSLYDSAPPIGLPESHNVKYGVYTSVGYDSNLNNTDRANREDGGFVRFGVTASYADYEAATKKQFSARIGGQLYDKDAMGTDERTFSDISISGTLSHAFSAGSQYVLDVDLDYTPEPDYSNGISAANTQGNCLSWSISNAYSRMIDCRWSWTANVSYNGNIYTDSFYEQDDRTYISGGLSLNLRQNSRTTYGLNTTIRHEDRSEGLDSDSWFTNLSVAHALSPTDSFSFSVGVQAKFIDGNSDLYPTIDFSYRRVLTKGLSARAYARFSNENVDTFSRGGNVNYLSNNTLRVGANLDYEFTHKVTFTGGVALIHSEYSEGQYGSPDYDSSTASFSVGMRYKFTNQLTGSINYTYTYGDPGSVSYINHYNRDVITAGLSYSF
ncbi:MAG: porin family protein [Akkermansiaceae bacterium]|nr:porin family protein [Akkermansiaceae bacterium]